MILFSCGRTAFMYACSAFLPGSPWQRTVRGEFFCRLRGPLPLEHAYRVQLPPGMNDVPETAVREFFRNLYQGCTQRLDFCRYYIGNHLGSPASLQMRFKTVSCMKIQRIAIGAGALVQDTSMSAFTAVSLLSQETPKKVSPGKQGTLPVKEAVVFAYLPEEERWLA